jgi:hypothetical protein
MVGCACQWDAAGLSWSVHGQSPRAQAQCGGVPGQPRTASRGRSVKWPPPSGVTARKSRSSNDSRRVVRNRLARITTEASASPSPRSEYCSSAVPPSRVPRRSALQPGIAPPRHHARALWRPRQCPWYGSGSQPRLTQELVQPGAALRLEQIANASMKRVTRITEPDQGSGVDDEGHAPKPPSSSSPGRSATDDPSPAHAPSRARSPGAVCAVSWAASADRITSAWLQPSAAASRARRSGSGWLPRRRSERGRPTR